MRRQQSANHESKKLHTGRVSAKSLSRAFNNGIKFPNDQLQKFSGRGWNEWNYFLQAIKRRLHINEKCQHYLLILEIKRQEGVSSFISVKKSAIDSEIPC